MISNLIHGDCDEYSETFLIILYGIATLSVKNILYMMQCGLLTVAIHTQNKTQS